VPMPARLASKIRKYFDKLKLPDDVKLVEID
jgi:hypothetical protein